MNIANIFFLLKNVSVYDEKQINIITIIVVVRTLELLCYSNIIIIINKLYYEGSAVLKVGFH